MSGKVHLQSQERTHDRDTVPADASVVLEDDVTTLVDREAVVLVVNHAKCMPVRSGYEKRPRWKGAHLFSMVKSVVLQSNPSVL